ncbi:MAG: efflux RND transporter periplasmic adaptor subunit [Treponema sp.]|nr:efflux RND transporter periplasmic adaptor subunit [Treponema sp.]
MKKSAPLCAAALILFSACGGSGDGKKAAPGEDAAQEAPVFAVNTTTAVKGRIQDYLALSGDITAGTTVDVFSDAAGKVVRVYVAIGDRVSRGAPIAAVDPSRAGMTYLPSVAEAPIAGVITALPAEVGMTVSQAVSLARIAGGNALEIRLYVAERFISRIALGQPCEIALDAWPGEVFRGSVSEVAPTVDPASRTMEVRVNVENPGFRLKTGMFAKVRIITEEKEGIVKIPASAVIQRFGETYLFSVETDIADPSIYVARKKNIAPGILIDGVMEIEEGLEPDEEIVIRGQTLLEDGARINIIDQAAPLSAR